jgi:hypothetical protein
MDRQTLRDWVHRYNAGGIEGLIDRKASGPEPWLTAEQIAELSAIEEQGPPSEGGQGRSGSVQKNFTVLVYAVIQQSARQKPIEIWFQDEPRIGQKGSLTRRWARCGSRPQAPRDQRHKWAYLFGAICQGRALGAWFCLAPMRKR